MEKSNKKTIVQAFGCISLVCLIWVCYFCVKHYGADRILEIKEDDFSWVYQTDSAEVEDGELVLDGFAFQEKVDAVGNNYEIVLHDLESKKNIFLEMSYSEREDVNKYFLCEYDYAQSGFKASTDAKKLKLDENNYEVLLRKKGERTAYKTGTYISEGKLMYTNPQGYTSLQAEAEREREIVNKGILRLYLPEKGFYVYQYDKKLYCLMEEKYKKEDMYFNRVVSYAYTTQIDRLPKEAQESTIIRDSFDSYFNDENKNGVYYICEIELPTQYSITRVDLGNFNVNWVWQETIRPLYEFE